MRTKREVGLWAVAILAAGAVAPMASGQYERQWDDIIPGSYGGQDVATDSVMDDQGNTFVVGWIQASATKTSYRLRVYDANGSWHSGNTTRTWGPHDGTNKAYGVAIMQDFVPLGELMVLTGCHIYITGEVASNGGAEGQNIGTIRYYYDYASKTISTASGENPAIQIYNNDAEDGDDVGLDIAVVGAYDKVVVTGWSEGDGTDLDSITVGYDPLTYFTSVSTPYYWEQRYDPEGDDLTSRVTVGPLVSDIPSCYIAGYTQGVSSDAFLALNLDVLDGTINEEWVYDTSSDERAHAVVMGDGNRVYVTGWTNAGILLGEEEDLFDPEIIIGPNYLTTCFSHGESDADWATLLNGTGNDADIAYSIAFLPYTIDEDDGDRQYPPAVVVGGASVGDETDFDYRAVAYDPYDGTVMDTGNCEWAEAGDGIYDGGNGDPDESYDMEADWMPGELYLTGRTWVSDFDFGTIRIFRRTGVVDNGSGMHAFPRFTWGGDADEDDGALAVSVNSAGDENWRNPDVTAAGYIVDSGTDTDMGVIQYYDPDAD